MPQSKLNSATEDKFSQDLIKSIKAHKTLFVIGHGIIPHPNSENGLEFLNDHLKEQDNLTNEDFNEALVQSIDNSIPNNNLSASLLNQHLELKSEIDKNHCILLTDKHLNLDNEFIGEKVKALAPEKRDIADISHEKFDKDFTDHFIKGLKEHMINPLGHSVSAKITHYVFLGCDFHEWYFQVLAPLIIRFYQNSQNDYNSNRIYVIHSAKRGFDNLAKRGLAYRWVPYQSKAGLNEILQDLCKKLRSLSNTDTLIISARDSTNLPYIDINGVSTITDEIKNSLTPEVLVEYFFEKHIIFDVHNGLLELMSLLKFENWRSQGIYVSFKWLYLIIEFRFYKQSLNEEPAEKRGTGISQLFLGEQKPLSIELDASKPFFGRKAGIKQENIKEIKEFINKARKTKKYTIEDFRSGIENRAFLNHSNSSQQSREYYDKVKTILGDHNYNYVDDTGGEDIYDRTFARILKSKTFIGLVDSSMFDETLENSDPFKTIRLESPDYYMLEWMIIFAANYFFPEQYKIVIWLQHSSLKDKFEKKLIAFENQFSFAKDRKIDYVFDDSSKLESDLGTLVGQQTLHQS